MRTHTLSSVFLLATLAVSVVPECVNAQDLHPSRRLSPIGIARAHVGDTYVKVTYGRPYIRSRQIFGANNDSTSFLVPYGEIWRTGASEATEITVTGPVLIADNPLDAGTYSVFTVPGEDSWVVHVSPQLGLDGTGIFNESTGEFTPNVYQPANDVFSFTTPRNTLPEEGTVEQFTISFEGEAQEVDMVLRWERTELRIPIRTP